MEIFLSVSIALFAGLMLTRVFRKLGLNFPDVTAFLIAGLIIGPYGLGRLGISGFGFNTMESVEQVSIVSTTALGFIAFAIGSEFRLSELKHTGKAATVIGIVQAVVASALVDISLIYTTLSFLAVVLLTKIYMGVYRQKRHREKTGREAAHDA